MKSIGKLIGLLGILQDLGPGEVKGTPGVRVKSYNPWGTTCGATLSASRKALAENVRKAEIESSINPFRFAQSVYGKRMKTSPGPL